MSHKVNDEIIEVALEQDVPVSKDLESVWAQLNHGIVESEFSEEEVMNLI